MTAQPDAAAHATPPEPDDLVAVLTHAAKRLNRGKNRTPGYAARLLALAERVKAYREAHESFTYALRRYKHGDAIVSQDERLSAIRALLAACLRAPTPTPNDDKDGAGPRMGESKEVGNPQGNVVHLASPSSPNDDKGGTTDADG